MKPSRLLVLGANGATGREVVGQALDAGHRVTAFVRRTDGLPRHPALEVVTGDPAQDRAALARAADGHDAAVSALGNALMLRNGRRPKILERATRTAVAALEQAGVRRLVVMLSYGSGATAPVAPLAVRLLGRTLLRADFADLGAAAQVLARSPLDWTAVHFGSLRDGPRTGRATVSTAPTRPAVYRVARADLAAVLLDAALTGKYARRPVVVSGGPR